MKTILLAALFFSTAMALLASSPSKAEFSDDPCDHQPRPRYCM